MIAYNKYRRIGKLIILLVTLAFAVNLNAQKAEPETELKYVKNSDSSRTITYIVKYTKSDAKKSSEAVGVPVKFVIGDSKGLSEVVKTNGYGIAKFVIDASKKMPFKNEKCTISASLLENEIVEPKSDSITIRDLWIDMKTELKDSVKTIIFSAFEINSKGQRIPVKTDFAFYVPRTFSKLKVAEGSTSDDGSGEVEFPEGIFGDTIGNVTLIGRVEENEIYGNVEKTQVVNWGIPTNYHVSKYHRALWTTFAPYWMIITLTILLLGVWGHYFFVIYKIIKINRESKII